MARRLELDEREARQSAAPLVFEDMVFAATAIRRTGFEATGGFDEAFTADGAYGNEDIELGYRLLRVERTCAARPKRLRTRTSRTRCRCW